MPKLVWDAVGERFYETGVNRGVLYIPNQAGDYDAGFPWNGLVSVTQSPSGAEATPQYADNIKYLNLVSAEEFGCTIEAFTYPAEFAQCDGTAEPTPGVYLGQQSRKAFGLSYQSRIGNDLQGSDYGYKIHLVYGALAAPTEKAHTTINDTPEAITFSWEVTTTPVEVPGFKPAAILTIDTTKISAAKRTALEDILYGTASTTARLPLPAEVIGLIQGSLTEVVPAVPTQAGNVITIPTTAGVDYKIDGVKVTGTRTITKNTIVTVSPQSGYTFPTPTDTDWLYKFT